MKKVLYLVNFEFRRIFAKLVLTAGAMLLAQISIFLIVLAMDKNYYLRFEHLLDLSFYHDIFKFTCGVIIFIAAYNNYQDIYGIRNINHLNTIPIKKKFIYLSKYISAMMSVLVIYAAQITNIFVTYKIYVSTHNEIPKMSNGLLLAFARSDFLRLLFPFDIRMFVENYIAVFLVVYMFLFIAIWLKNKDFTRIIVVSLVLWLYPKVFDLISWLAFLA
ncbi:UNVERIFIED_CONTAM: hypothetical protein Cloal_0127 [Acetivibrio alkalicellulosi]